LRQNKNIIGQQEQENKQQASEELANSYQNCQISLVLLQYGSLNTLKTEASNKL
jgi:hypothetical protein